MIDMATVQHKLIAFKEKYSTADTDPGRVVPGYWRRFRKRNDHILVSKKVKNTSLTSHNGLLTPSLHRCMTRLGKKISGIWSCYREGSGCMDGHWREYFSGDKYVRLQSGTQH